MMYELVSMKKIQDSVLEIFQSQSSHFKIFMASILLMPFCSNKIFNVSVSGSTTDIKKYGSAFYVGIGQVKNGHLYLRYGSNSKKTTAKCNKTVTDKKACLYYCKNVPGVQLSHTKAEKNKLENLNIVILHSSFFFFLHHA